AGREPLVGEVRKRLDWPDEPRLDLVEAPHPLAVVLPPGDVARIKGVAVLLFRLGLTVHVGHALFLAVLRPCGKARRGAKRRQPQARNGPDTAPHEREANARALMRCSRGRSPDERPRRRAEIRDIPHSAALHAGYKQPTSWPRISP